MPVPPTAPGAIALALIPEDSAFGDGSHPTTRLCAGAVDFLCRQSEPSSFLDVGTGTGVLARIARARGVPRVAATDIDPVALTSARAHSRLDQGPGSIDIRDAAPDTFDAPFDLVAANILEGVLRALAPTLGRALAPGGRLLLSGFTRPQTPALKLVYADLGFHFISESHLDEWALLMFRR